MWVCMRVQLSMHAQRRHGKQRRATPLATGGHSAWAAGRAASPGLQAAQSVLLEVFWHVSRVRAAAVVAVEATHCGHVCVVGWCGVGSEGALPSQHRDWQGWSPRWRCP